MKKYNEIIRGLREDRDLKQSVIADLLETTQQHYSKYEKGNVEIPVRSIIKLAEYYNVSTDYILGRVRYSKNVQELESLIQSTPLIAEVISDMSSLSSESKKAISEYVSLLKLKENLS